MCGYNILKSLISIWFEINQMNSWTIYIVVSLQLIWSSLKKSNSGSFLGILHQRFQLYFFKWCFYLWVLDSTTPHAKLEPLVLWIELTLSFSFWAQSSSSLTLFNSRKVETLKFLSQPKYISDCHQLEAGWLSKRTLSYETIVPASVA